MTRLLYPVPLIILLLVWQLYSSGDSHRHFIFSSPTQVAATFIKLLANGELLRNSGVTLFEAVAGFLLGTITGGIIGLSFWYSPLAARIAKPYIAALGSIPIFALTPMIIAWFGIGITSKVMLAFIATLAVAIVQSYQGTMSVERRFLRSMHVLGATRFQTFKTVVVPSSLIWLLNAMKLNIGLALLGAFIGEFISSEQGLGYMIVRASGLYDIATVLVGVIALIVIALTLTASVEKLERLLMPWKAAV